MALVLSILLTNFLWYGIDKVARVDVVVFHRPFVPNLVDGLVVEDAKVTVSKFLTYRLKFYSGVTHGSSSGFSMFWGKFCHLVRPLWVAIKATTMPIFLTSSALLEKQLAYIRTRKRQIETYLRQ